MMEPLNRRDEEEPPPQESSSSLAAVLDARGKGQAKGLEVRLSRLEDMHRDERVKPAVSIEGKRGSPLIYNKETTVDFSKGNFGEKLTETQAKKAEEWTEKKAFGQDFSRMLRQAQGWKYGSEVEGCATQLFLERGEQVYKARPFSTCKRRWCPICEWLKSRKRMGNALANLPDLIKGRELRWRFLTLTVRNCEALQLPVTVGMMLRAFRKLTQRDIWGGVVGFIRAIEITYNARTHQFHPHLHVLQAVNASSSPYHTREWVQAWRGAMTLPYNPVCDIRAVKSLKRGLVEVMKYTAKPIKLAGAGVMALVQALESLKGRRLVQGGGILSSIFDDVKLISEARQVVGVFWWRAAEREYRRLLKGDCCKA